MCNAVAVDIEGDLGCYKLHGLRNIMYLFFLQVMLSSYFKTEGYLHFIDGEIKGCHPEVTVCFYWQVITSHNANACHVVDLNDIH